MPGLAVVLVGDDPASAVYVRAKGQGVRGSGNAQRRRSAFRRTTTQAELLAHVRRAQRRPTVHGILVQMPLPKQIDPDAVIRAIDPAKDVDGFHPVNVGKLLIGETRRIRAVHAGRDSARCCSESGVETCGRGVRDRWPQQHRRQADGGAADAEHRPGATHGHRLSQPHARSRSRTRGAPTF